MQNRILAVLASGLLAASLLSAGAFAQDVPDHPRVNEVDQRLQDQQNRVNSNVSNGNMTEGQAARDEARDAKVQQQLSKDEAKHNGHITKAEQRHMNHELNHNSRDIHRQHDKGVVKKETAQ